MRMWPVAGAIFGGMLGVFVAKEFTENWLIWFGAGTTCACAGIILCFLFRREEPDPSD